MLFRHVTFDRVSMTLHLLGLRRFHLSVKIVDQVASSREVRFVILQGMV
jgi:hypothetical protein